MNWYFTDTQVEYVVEISNGALSYTSGEQVLGSNVSVMIERSALNELLLKPTTLGDLMKAGRLEISRGLGDFLWFFSLLDTGDPNFPIVTPKNPPLPSMDAPKQDAASADDEVLGRVWQLAGPLLRGC